MLSEIPIFLLPHPLKKEKKEVGFPQFKDNAPSHCPPMAHVQDSRGHLRSDVRNRYGAKRGYQTRFAKINDAMETADAAPSLLASHLEPHRRGR